MRETNSPVNQPVQSDADVETTIGLTDLWSMCITRWYWFLLSLVVALVVAVVYLMSAPRCLHTQCFGTGKGRCKEQQFHVGRCFE